MNDTSSAPPTYPTGVVPKVTEAAALVRRPGELGACFVHCHHDPLTPCPSCDAAVMLVDPSGAKPPVPLDHRLSVKDKWEVTKGQPEGSVGDINSTAKGSGARYNAGKAPFNLVPLRLIAESYGQSNPDLSPAQRSAVWSLVALGAWQEDGDIKHLYTAMKNLGLSEGWTECAKVFDYGRKKYAEWNWAKGMQWSIPMECAARHLLAIINGEPTDEDKVIDGQLVEGSKLPHRGHVFCNIVMLLTFIKVYPEGDNRPRCLA